jgi:hypothetical protein
MQFLELLRAKPLYFGQKKKVLKVGDLNPDSNFLVRGGLTL